MSMDALCFKQDGQYHIIIPGKRANLKIDVGVCKYTYQNIQPLNEFPSAIPDHYVLHVRYVGVIEKPYVTLYSTTNFQGGDISGEQILKTVYNHLCLDLEQDENR